jgi:hypothetical protein
MQQKVGPHSGADVDGTLLKATGPDSNKLHKLAFAHAMKEVFEVDTNIGKLRVPPTEDVLTCWKVS